MKKILSFLAIAVILLGILYIFFLWLAQSPGKTRIQPVESNPPVSLDKNPPAVLPQNINTVSIRTKSGASIPVRDFRNDPLVESFNDQDNDPNYIYYIFRDTDSPSTATYEVLYSGNDKSIVVSLRKEPLRDVRFRAEIDLARHLNVDPEKLCDLSISIGVARDVNELYAGRELGISTCPGSQPL